MELNDDAFPSDVYYFPQFILIYFLTTGRVLVGWGDYSGDKSSGSGRRQSSVGQNTESKNP